MASQGVSANPPVASEDMVVLNERFGILPESRLPAYDSGTAEAYSAADLQSGSANFYALVCAPGAPPRKKALGGFAQITQTPLVVPEEWGVIDWMPNQGRRFVIVMQKPAGERLQSPGSEGLPKLKEYEIQYRVLIPLLPALEAISARALTHCAIRVDNLFYADPDRNAVMLGESVSGPPGYSQPPVYETIERAMAMPSGRGPGLTSDDLYSLGVTLALLLQGHDPCAGMTAREIVSAKLRTGSYNLLVDRMRVSLPFMELLRGLLCDDPRERWTLADLEMWVSGRHMSPKQPILPPSAQRPFDFCGEAFWTLRGLAHALSCNWSEAAIVVEEGRLETWVRRSLSDDIGADAIADVIRTSQTGGLSPALARDRMVAQILMLLDPSAPLRYKDLAASIDSLTSVLALEFNNPEMRACYAEAVAGGLPQGWLAAQKPTPQHLTHLRRDFERAGQMLNRLGPEVGLIRCLYEFNPDWPCQSPLVERDCVLNAHDLLCMLERLAETDAPQVVPVDPHMAAFCAARLRRTKKHELEQLLKPSDQNANCVAALNLLAQAQSAVGPQRLPRLAGWLVGHLGPAIEAFHNRPYRNQLAQDVTKVAAEGDLQVLANLVDNADVRLRDNTGFAQAQMQFQQIVHQMKWLEAGGLTNRQQVMRGSQHFSTIVSAILSALALVALTLVYAS